MLRVPLVLPELTVEMNYIGNVAILGYVLFGLVALTSLGFAAWIVWKRTTRVVKGAQPIFLILVLAGVLLMSSAIIPMTIDDEHYSLRACDIACNATPWLVSLGFCLTFAALFSKLWRIGRIMQASRSCRRQTVAVRDVLTPLVVLLSINLILLICWTALAPLRFVRNDHHGTDLWYRVISTYGSCVAHEHISSVPFVALLTIVNLGALVILNVQAYKTRSINTEYSESKYIVIVVASMAQAGFIGIPLLFLVGEEPQATFVVRVLLIFVTCSAILCLIFIPKILNSKDVEKQRRDYTLTRDTRTTRSGQSKVIESTQGSVIGTSSVNLSA